MTITPTTNDAITETNRPKVRRHVRRFKNCSTICSDWWRTSWLLNRIGTTTTCSRIICPTTLGQQSVPHPSPPRRRQPSIFAEPAVQVALPACMERNNWRRRRRRRRRRCRRRRCTCRGCRCTPCQPSSGRLLAVGSELLLLERAHMHTCPTSSGP